MNIQSQTSRRSGFTLIELLTVIAIIGILAAILIPAVGAVRVIAEKAASMNNGKQIAIAYNTYANSGGTTRRIQPGSEPERGLANSAQTFAEVLAIRADLNDAALWYITNDPAVVSAEIPQSVVNPSTNAGLLSASAGPISWGVVINVPSTAPASQSPLVFTRGVGETGTEWSESSPWLGEGGHVVFLDASARWYDSFDPAEGGTALTDLEDGGEADSIGAVYPAAFAVQIEEDS